MGTLTICRMYFLEDDVHDGNIDLDTVREETETFEVSAREAADKIIAEGLVFCATGTIWAGNPDGTTITDYAKGERCETTAHLSGFPIRVENAIMEVVG